MQARLNWLYARNAWWGIQKTPQRSAQPTVGTIRTVRPIFNIQHEGELTVFDQGWKKLEAGSPIRVKQALRRLEADSPSKGIGVAE